MAHAASTEEPRRERLDLDGAAVEYSVLGQEGPALICSDLPLNPFALFGPLQRALSSRFRTYVVDLRPAVGASDEHPPAEDLLGYCADLLLSVAARLGLPRFSVAGSFMFGAVAMEAALRAPTAVERLVLLNSLGTATLPATPVMRFITGFYRLPFMPWMYRVKVLRWFIEWFDQRLLSPIRMKELFAAPAQVPLSLEDLYEHYKRPPVPHAGHALLWLIRDMRYEGLRTRLAQVAAPALLIVGQQDRWIPLERQRALCAALPRASLVEVPGTMHAPEIEKVADVTELIQEFCGSAARENKT